MDLATVVGFAIGNIIIIIAIFLGGDIGLFINIPSVLIVIGCGTAATMMCFTLQQFLGVFKVLMKAFMPHVIDTESLIKQFCDYSVMVRQNGFLALENELGNITNVFMKKGLGLLVDGVKPEVLESLMKADMTAVAERHKVGQDVFKAMAKYMPAFGMVGTLVGLVQMLATLSDPASIGPKMAVALLTTLYGAFMANMVCAPIAEKLKKRTEEEVLYKKMVLQGLLALQEGLNPNIIEEKLKVYFTQEIQKKIGWKKK